MISDIQIKQKLDEIVKLFNEINPYDTRWSHFRLDDDFEIGDGEFAIVDYYIHRDEEYTNYIAWFPEELIHEDFAVIRQTFETERKQRLEQEQRDRERKTEEEKKKLEEFQRNHFIDLVNRLSDDLPLNFNHLSAVYAKLTTMARIYHEEVVGSFNNHFRNMSLVPWASYLPDDVRSFGDPFFIEVIVSDNSFGMDTYYLRAETLFAYFEEKQK